MAYKLLPDTFDVKSNFKHLFWAFYKQKTSEIIEIVWFWLYIERENYKPVTQSVLQSTLN